MRLLTPPPSPHACSPLTFAVLLAAFGYVRLHALHAGIPFAGPLPATLTLILTTLTTLTSLRGLP
eukprot:361564-Chlamydomonas_euryale.AAC.3